MRCIIIKCRCYFHQQFNTGENNSAIGCMTNAHTKTSSFHLVFELQYHTNTHTPSINQSIHYEVFWSSHGHVIKQHLRIKVCLYKYVFIYTHMFMYTYINKYIYIYCIALQQKHETWRQCQTKISYERNDLRSSDNETRLNNVSIRT